MVSNFNIRRASLIYELLYKLAFVDELISKSEKLRLGDKDMILYNYINEQMDDVIIRPLTILDYDEWFLGYDNQLESKSKYDEGKFDTSFLTKQWYEDKLIERELLANDDRCYLFNIFRVEDGVFIGNCDITTHMREDFQYARVGYTIHNQYWNNGYATQALKGLINIGFDSLKFHRLEAHINLDNIASKKVAIKAGMELECVRKSFILEDGRWTDNEVYFIVSY